MLVKVDVITSRGTTLSLDIFENDSGYQLADVDGLNPVKAVLSSSPYVGMDGEDFQSSRRGFRQLKLILDLEPDFETSTFYSLRLGLYEYLMPQEFVRLRFYTDTGLYVDINGVVEEHSSPMADEDPQVTVTIICFQPDLVDPNMVSIDGSSVSTSTVTNINYPGTIKTGVVMTLHVNRNVAGFTMYNSVEEGVLSQLDFSYPLINGDQLVISSLKGSKGITLTRAGVSSSLLYGRSPQSTWIELSKGVNQFRVYAPGDPVPYTLEYMVRYGGL
jgi:hypothetical protein